MTPGEVDEAHAEMERARQALDAARLLLDAASTEGAASRLYYAAFHATRAALLVRGMSSKTHSGQIRLFVETYGATPLPGRLLALRVRADYEVGESVVALQMIQEHVGDVERLLARCAEIVEQAAAQGPDEQDPPPDR